MTTLADCSPWGLEVIARASRGSHLGCHIYRCTQHPASRVCLQLRAGSCGQVGPGHSRERPTDFLFLVKATSLTQMPQREITRSF